MKFNLPVIILNGTVLLPEAQIKLEFADEISKNILDEAELFHGNKILIVTKMSIDENIIISDLPKIGTITEISKKLLLPNGKVRVALKGLKRANVLSYLNPSKDSIESIVAVIPDVKLDEYTNNAFIRKLTSELNNYVNKVPYISDSLFSLISDTDNLSKITDIIINNISVDNKRLLDYLMEENSTNRVKMILEDIYKEERLFNIENSIEDKLKKELDEEQKNAYIKEKIKLLKDELGDISTEENEIIELRNKVKNLNSNEAIKTKISYEIDRYENMSSLSPEKGIIRNYIDLMLSLPWNTYTTDIEDLKLISSNLDKDHFGLYQVKQRIVEYLAVKKQSSDLNAPIICLVGPPGVGKTTLAKSIAESIGRNFVKISMGGVDDESIIKGHIRTYIGALPGKIIDGIKRAKSSNPVFLIDEIDKMGSNYKGDPASALLEVLDNNQNKYFKDNYLEEEYDLSRVLFIATANDINLIPTELKDRLEIIKIEGYTQLEKLEIAKNYLIPTICDNHKINKIKISDGEILDIINFYTRESGIRELERMISKIVRKIITNKILNEKKMLLTVKSLDTYLGKKIYGNDIICDEIGIVNALACTSYGGEVLKIEVNYYEGNGDLILTGSMGSDMIESSKIALSYIKASYKYFNIDYNIFKNDIHINIPDISTKKDGPSAGVAIVTSIISAISNLKISNKIAMTGEITLRGNVVKIGGLKEKILGAYINGIDTIFIPYSNLMDIDEIPKEIMQKIKIIPVKKYIEIYEYLVKRDNL